MLFTHVANSTIFFTLALVLYALALPPIGLSLWPKLFTNVFCRQCINTQTWMNSLPFALILLCLIDLHDLLGDEGIEEDLVLRRLPEHSLEVVKVKANELVAYVDELEHV